jgi:DNA polymerase I-like protein with 3'-5' exonuclease and polymerase domains
MRNDAVGMFWEDVQTDRVRGEVIRPQPPIPDTGWITPTAFPRLDSAPVICLDTETYDPELLDRGPGWARGVGHVVGVSIAVPNHPGWYFPVRHTIQPETNMDPAKVFAWLQDTLGGQTPKVGANLAYDIGWLAEEGVQVNGPLFDVQFAEALLDESSDVALEVLCQRYLGMGKVTEQVYQWCADFYGGNADGRQRKNLWRAPPCLVGPYAIGDVELPLKVLERQWPQLEREGLLPLFEMENGLIPLLVAMRREGVSVSIPRAEQTRDQLGLRAREGEKRLRDLVGFDVNVNAADSIASAFNKVGVPYGKTATGKPSFTKEFLSSVEHPVAELITTIRKYEKLRGTFVESYILDSHIAGKVYGQFHSLRGEGNGTRSGRLSSSTPNLQNLPSRDEELAPLVRGIFVPDEGHARWIKIDYSQIEYRFMIHYAVGPGSDDARRLFNEHPDTDYHEMALDLVAPAAGWDITSAALRKQRRKPIKNINFGLIYGMGVDKLSRSLGLSAKEGRALFAAYHRGVPFAKPTMDAAAQEATDLGSIRTVFGRKSRFDLWEPASWGASDGGAQPYEKAILKWGNIRRAYTHKALNRRLQGSAADLMKMAMYRCWKDGIFERTGVPRLTVHDELDFSDPGGRADAFTEMRHIMETAIPLAIPVRADADAGPDWGHCTAIEKF